MYFPILIGHSHVQLKQVDHDSNVKSTFLSICGFGFRKAGSKSSLDSTGGAAISSSQRTIVFPRSSIIELPTS